MRISIISHDIELIKSLRQAPDHQSAAALDIGEGRRIPGQADTLAEIWAQVTTLPAGVAASLIAAWIWSAWARSATKAKAHLLIEGEKGRTEIDIEGFDHDRLTKLLEDAIRRVDWP